MDENNEKRDSTRIEFKEKVKYGQSDRPATEGVSINLSKSGLAIKSYKTLPPGTRISMMLYCGGKPLKIEGEVIWNTSSQNSEYAEMGIKITSRTDELNKIYSLRSQS